MAVLPAKRAGHLSPRRGRRAGFVPEVGGDPHLALAWRPRVSPV